MNVDLWDMAMQAAPWLVWSVASFAAIWLIALVVHLVGIIWQHLRDTQKERAIRQFMRELTMPPGWK